MKREYRTVDRSHQVDSHQRSAICRWSISSSTRRRNCWNWRLESGLKVVTAMLECTIGNHHDLVVSELTEHRTRQRERRAPVTSKEGFRSVLRNEFA
jgi:hypothetical protein